MLDVTCECSRLGSPRERESDARYYLLVLELFQLYT